MQIWSSECVAFSLTDLPEWVQMESFQGISRSLLWNAWSHSFDVFSDQVDFCVFLNMPKFNTSFQANNESCSTCFYRTHGDVKTYPLSRHFLGSPKGAGCGAKPKTSWGPTSASCHRMVATIVVSMCWPIQFFSAFLNIYRSSSEFGHAWIINED